MALEAAYLMDNYPSDDQYRKLAGNLQLTTLQVKEWFCKRRKKSKDGSDAGTPQAVATADAGIEAEAEAEAGAGTAAAENHGSMGVNGANGAAAKRRRRRTSGDLKETNHSMLAVRIIDKARVLLTVGSVENGCPRIDYREDGPPLALYFDQIPIPNPRGRGSKRSQRQAERQELSKLLTRVKEEERARKREEIELRKREQEATRRQKQAEKEAERAFRMQQKLEQMERKELERQKRMAEKLEKERELAEMKRLKEEERAKARIEKQMMREEMKRKREEELQERKRLREFERMKAAEERAQLKLLQERRKQIVEDEELERQEILEERKKEAEAKGEDAMDVDQAAAAAKITLAPFPPKEVHTIQIFDPSNLSPLGLSGQLTPEVEQDVLMIWKFIRDYTSVINFSPMSLGEVAGMLALGMESKKLGDLHMSILKLLLADVEEAHSLVNQEEGMDHKGGQISGLDRVVHNFAKYLGEIWDWGFGSDLLRAQRNYLTWPEVMRQFLVIFGYGPERPKLKKKKDAEVKEANLVDDKGNPLGPKMKPPATCRPGTIKGAAWTVLAEAGVEGMTSQEITDKMNELGLRTMSQGGAKTPEASVNGALSRDSFVFEKVGNHKYALRVLCSWHRRQQKREKDLAEGKVQEPEQDGKAQSEGTPEAEDNPGDDNPDLKAEKLRPGEDWVRKVATTEYNKLTMFERTKCLVSLCNSVLECPSLYQKIEASMKEKDAQTKRLREVQRDERKLRLAIHQAVTTAAIAAAASGKSSDNPGEGGSPEKPKEEEARAGEGAQVPGVQTKEDLEAALAAIVKEKNEILTALQTLTEEVNRLPLGLDRRFNRYWFLKLSEDVEVAKGAEAETEAEGEAKPKRGKNLLLIEDFATHSLRVVRDKASLDLLVTKLNPRGLRESKLIEALKKRTRDILETCLPAAPCPVVLPEAERDFMTDYPTEAMSVLLKEGKRPPSGAMDLKSSSFLTEKLKGDMLDIYQALPPDSFDDNEWDGPSVWTTKVRSATELDDLRDILGELEGAVKAKVLDHDHFNRNPRIVPGGWVPRDDDMAAEDEGEDGMVGYVAQEGDLSWLPTTTSALQYRLRCLDAVCTFRRSTKSMSKRIDAYKYIQRDNPINKDLGTNFTYVTMG